ncbi:phage major capsid protein [Pseudooctadecabacter jejudonensis]|uniref:Phage capsid family protein n=1 Tax=Pseudooctadecabacter jejudonensis TaxID=1391910 RepID=A0A1Y5R770_9RHOB|nr:phage major capsid protein [Pseudooctadecabacter jejudonensis]SLN10747.1 Phage capsid family protein [Pseudooctadecabacter jejudonensis]
MLDSVKIQTRQSTIRQELSALVGKAVPDADETRSIDDLSAEYETNEKRFRAALISEDTQRQEAKGELDTRSDKEFSDMVSKFELRQVALHLDEGRALDGVTAEVVQELRSQGGFRGTPVPYDALEQRAGETIASGTPDPMTTRPLIERLFPQSVAAKMGGSMIQIGSGETEFPVTTSSVTASWQGGELAEIDGPQAYTTVDKALAPDNTLGIQMRISRKTMKQSGAALEQAVRRDMNGAIAQEVDRVVFQGTGADGQPLGLFTGATTYGIAQTPIDAAASWSAFRAAVVEFMTANAASGPNAVKLLMRPEIWAALDDALTTGTAVSEWDRLVKNIPAGNIAMTSNALAAPVGDPLASSAILSTNSGGVAPFFVGLWGAVDLIRDPYADAASGGLRLTALSTMDVTVARGVQSRILTGIQ